jgi:predicted ATP-grasp superfamily ATP-dependent carboligase
MVMPGAQGAAAATAEPVLQPRAIVLGVEHPRAAAVVQSLGRMGVRVIGLDHERAARGMYSRYIAEKVFVDATPEAALAKLESLTHHRGAVLIPTNDRYLTLVSQNAARLSRHFTLTTPPWSIVGRLMDKRQCYTLGRSLGLGVPRFFTPASDAELERVLAELDFARHGYVLTKPLPIAEPTDVSTRRFTRVAGLDAPTLRARCHEIAARIGELPMIAEVVPGQSDTCIGVSMVLDADCEPVAWFCVKRLQLRPYEKDEGFVHPYELGANVFCESTHDDEAIAACGRLLKAAGYYGIATVEFRRDLSDGSLKIIKVDPRFVRATGLSRTLGIDLPGALFRAFTGAAPIAPRSYASGVAWIWVSWYLDTVIAQGPRVFVHRLGELVRDARRIRAAAYLSARDPLPFVVDAWRWLRNWLGRGRRALRIPPLRSRDLQSVSSHE